MNDEVYLWHVEKQQNFQQVHFIILGLHSHASQSTKNRKFAYLCNSYRKTWGMKLLSCLQINTKVFYVVASIILGFLSSLAQSTQNNKFVLSLQYLKKNEKNEVGFFYVNNSHNRQPF